MTDPAKAKSRPIAFTLGFTLIVVLLGTLLVVSQVPHEFCILFIVPILYAIYHYPRWVYRCMLAIVIVVSVWVIYSRLERVGASLRTTAFLSLTIVLAGELVQRAIGERRQVEEALRESESRSKSIFRAAPIGIGVMSNRVLKEVNDRFCSMVGYTREELLDQSARMLYSTDEDYEYVGSEKYAQIRERGTGTVESRWRRKDGRIIDVLLSSTLLEPNDSSAGVTFTALDITDRKRTERALERSERLYREAIEVADAVPYFRNYRTDQFEFFGTEIERLIGYSPSELYPDL
ncbi:MAG: PAS domain S-box protein, partial [bacterium]